MNKNLIIFYGEWRVWPGIYELYKERYNIDNNYDIIVSTWNQNRGKPFRIKEWMGKYPHISLISKENEPYCMSLKKVEHCIIYHCKTALDLIDTSQYENIILCRTDVITRLHKLDLNKVEENTIYRWFDNIDKTPDSFMNDMMFVGKSNTIKKYFDDEYKVLPNIFKGENFNTTDKLLSGVHGVDPTKSVSDVKCSDIENHLLTYYDETDSKTQFISLVKERGYTDNTPDYEHDITFWREWIWETPNVSKYNSKRGIDNVIYSYVENILPPDRQNYIEEYAKSNTSESASIVNEGGKQKGYNIPFINEKNPSIGKDIVHMSKSMMKKNGRGLKSIIRNRLVYTEPHPPFGEEDTKDLIHRDLPDDDYWVILYFVNDVVEHKPFELHMDSGERIPFYAKKGSALIFDGRIPHSNGYSVDGDRYTININVN